ncbi:hypothetical protein COHA_008560 [Chlorella ohadii]|uniref:Aminopeptidase N n=1 Tax=Chlorella ohadii TaxID=2649997 RepID=A0AAD5DJZ5_9CHLO|nr:hypothetical protein COHA_008560 [Chlorella ohadii]
MPAWGCCWGEHESSSSEEEESEESGSSEEEESSGMTDAHLTFRLHPEETVVDAVLTICAAAPAAPGYGPPPLVLDGRKDLRLVSVAVEGRQLAHGQYHQSPKALTIAPNFLPPAAAQPGAQFQVATRVLLCPRANTHLEGLFMSGGLLVTDNEPEGFRGITFFIDRPDVAARYTVRLEADKTACPVLLSNGKCKESGDLPNGWHFATWVDPVPKPSYLFCLVAGQLASLEGRHVTQSGRTIQLRVWADREEIEARRADWALACLQAAMRWDEATFGVECDLDLFQIVAVPSLQSGGMENVGLNTFDASHILACPATATDDDYQNVERTVAHEFFHHQTGNRVTVRNWFQLTLKEGLTVYREQEFAASTQYKFAPCARVEAASDLREGLLDEDSGPLAHPPRPAEVCSVENFYSDTVYNKGAETIGMLTPSDLPHNKSNPLPINATGAEIVRMLETSLGRPAFLAGLRSFLEQHRGGSATCEDLLAAMAGAAGDSPEAAAAARLMLRWYDQAGTPEVEAAGEWNPNARTFTLRLSQRTEPTPGEPRKQPVPIPVAVALLGRGSGRQLPLRLASGTLAPVSLPAAAAAPASLVLLLTAPKQTWVFSGVEEEPVLSLLRGCSAPVTLTVKGRRDADLALLVAADQDPYVRWDAVQELGLRALLKMYRAALAKGGKYKAGAPYPPPAAVAAAEAAAAKAAAPLVPALRHVLTADPVGAAEFGAWALNLPGDMGIYERDDGDGVDPGMLQVARQSLERALAAALRPELGSAVLALDAALGVDTAAPGGPTRYAVPYAYSAQAAAQRSMRQAALHLLAALGEPAVLADLQARLAGATNLTEAVGAAEALDRAGGAARAAALAAFHDAWGGNTAGLHAWMGLVAGSEQPGNLAEAAALPRHPGFQLGSPGASLAVWDAFSGSNFNFHAPDGSGYKFVADAVLLLDKVNRWQAAELAANLVDWEAVEPRRSRLLRAQLERLAATRGLSSVVMDLVEAALEEDSDDE